DPKMLVAPANASSRFNNRLYAEPYCRCWHKRMKQKVAVPAPCDQPNECSCGEEDDVKEWRWERPAESESSRVVLSENDQLVTFHPVYSSGTAAVKGDTPMKHNYHYYWEMVGLGSDKFDITEYRHTFASPLGSSPDSYGLSYTGKVHHDSRIISDASHGFCKGSIIGIRLDMWRGTLEFYINRKSQGISSSIKLVYAASWSASLMVDALKILAASVTEGAVKRLPPGLRYRLKTQFWLTMPPK
ncbi:SPRY domain-containing SOCS box protein, partial [Operophtera brumata]